MAGKQAKTLAARDIATALRHIQKNHRYPNRDRVVFLLSVKAGMRAGEIAKLTWPMLTNSRGQVGRMIELHNSAAKKGSGRMIPLNKELRSGLIRLRKEALDLDGPVICSERGGACSPRSIVNWFRALYRMLEFEGCSSHSGRRTFITNAARIVAKVGGSLRDVQQLAGHRSIDQTQSYIEGNNEAKRRLVQLI